MDDKSHEQLGAGLIIIRRAGEATAIEGELNEASAAEFEQMLSSAHEATKDVVKLDLSRLDIEGGVAIAAAVNAIRALAACSKRVIISGAPQMLGHNLYRIGMLEGAIEFVDIRLDEPLGE